MGPILRVVTAALAVVSAVAPGPVLAGPFHGGPSSIGYLPRSGGGPGVASRPSPPGNVPASGGFFARSGSGPGPASRPSPPGNPFPGHGFGHHHHGHVGRGSNFGPFGFGLVYVPPLYGGVYYDPSAVYDPPVSPDPAAGYDPPTAYAPPPFAYTPQTGGVVTLAPAPPPPPAPPTPSVIEYPTGRYELRGDGVTSAYTWVWIPNPPPAPPTEAPAPVGPSWEPASGEPSPGHRNQVYRWTDEQGVTHFTDRWDLVPEEYRSQARRLRSS